MTESGSGFTTSREIRTGGKSRRRRRRRVRHRREQPSLDDTIIINNYEMKMIRRRAYTLIRKNSFEYYICHNCALNVKLRDTRGDEERLRNTFRSIETADNANFISYRSGSCTAHNRTRRLHHAVPRGSGFRRPARR